MIARYRLATLACVTVLLLIPFLLFASVTLGQATLLPVDNLFQWEPFRTYAPTLGVSIPQNHLLSDLILENYVWKQFIIKSLQHGEIPLWNPNIFAGVPFLAAGQHSALYPPSILYYVLPLDKAYGWYTVLNLGLAGVFMFIFMRTLGIRRRSATFAGAAYQLSAFMVVSVVFQMVIASAAWLPLILAMCERIIRQAPAIKGKPSSVPWVVIGALAITMHVFAGHVEITVYTALIAAGYCLWQLAAQWRNRDSGESSSTGQRRLWRSVLWLSLMAFLGLAMSGVQLLPLLELVQSSFRATRSSLQEVMSYGFPPRHVLLWFMPNFYGNPSQHTFFNLFTSAIEPVRTASGHTEWGIKNYVEGGAFVGIVALVLAGIGAFTTRPAKGSQADAKSTPPVTESVNRVPRGFFIVLGVLAVLFAFGTPLYALLYYGLPGINQLHSPFRWVFALTFCLVALAGIGVDRLIDIGDTTSTSTKHLGTLRRLRYISISGIALSIVMLFGIAISRVAWSSFSPIIERLYTGLAKANEGYPDVQAFFSAQAFNVAILALSLAACAVLLLMAQRHAIRKVWAASLLGLLLLECVIAWWGFNPSVDTQLLSVKPKAIEFLQQDTSHWRLTTYDPTGEKPLNANAAWLYNLQDIRGYDSIIPRQYTNYMALIEPQNELLYNRIAPLTRPESLESPLLDMLNMKYIMTAFSTTISTPGMTEVFVGDGVRIYRNERVMPRAFTLPASSALLTHDFAHAVQQQDPRQYVIIDANCGITDLNCVVPTAGQYAPSNITSYRNNEVWIDAQITQTSWLILTDSYFPGWRAFVRPFGAPDEDEREVPVGLANGNFRAVHLEVVGSTDAVSVDTKPLGDSALQASAPTDSPSVFTVRFKYSPDSFRLGVFASFLAFMALLLILAVYLWRHYYHEGLTASPIRRIAKNSLVLTGFNLIGRLIDFAFAIVMLRLLGPEGVGKYAFAIVIIGWFEILMNFGLNTFLTREVARDRANANKYLYNTSLLRLFLGAGTAPLVILVIVVWRLTFGLADDTAIAIVILAVSQIISSMATGLSALFFAYEKAEIPAAMTIVSTLIKVSLGALALLAGFGIVGLAGSSLVTNTVTLVVLLSATIRIFFRPQRQDDPTMRKSMLRESFPLMLNHLLATLFFKIDVPLLEAMRSATVVGWYSAAYKYVDAFNVIPAFFTQSIFPALSRMAKENTGAMAQSLVLSLKLLIITALPLAVLTTAFAPWMIEVLGGAEFLPHSSIALMLMIWSIPFGWINSITNYALIAVNQQRALTRAFIIGLAFNVITNLIFIPLYSYQAAAVTTIFSEIVMGAAFYWYVRRYIVRINWFNVLGRPALAAACMAAAIAALASVGLLLPGALVGLLIYAFALYVIRAISREEQQLLAPLLPARFRIK